MKSLILIILGIFLGIVSLFSLFIPNPNIIVSIFWLIISLIILYYAYKNMNNNNNNNNNIDSYQKTNNYDNEYYYVPKKFLTSAEITFYNKMHKIQELGYIIIPQVNLASIVEKHRSRYRNELFRNIDFGIFDKNFNLLLLIELNDSTHQKINRRDRDLKVKKILNDCHIKLINFYTQYPNEENYVCNKILENIGAKDLNN